MDRKEIKAIIFDMDGTLIDSGLDAQAFIQLRKDLGLSAEDPILLDQLSGQQFEIIDRFEAAGVERSKPIPGCLEWLEYLEKSKIPYGILSRNSRRNVQLSFAKWGIEIEHSIGREDAIPKPDPDGVFKLCQRFTVHPSNTLMIGDYVHDFEAGYAAGAQTAILRGERTSERELELASYVWDTLMEGLQIFKSLSE